MEYDPIVLSHGRALLADDKTTKVFTADMRDPRVREVHLPVPAPLPRRDRAVLRRPGAA
ncbi:MAG TPA: hypothetical protein VFE59_38275 [Trebonia sp.]|nr:hypothetical protein [Trebonia sp.]